MLSMKENVAPVANNKPNADSPMTAKVKQFNNLSLNLDADFDEVASQKYEDEPVLAPNTKRFVLFPIQYNGVCLSCIVSRDIFC